MLRLSSHRLNLAILTLLPLLLLTLFLRTELALTGGRLGVPLDDAWIHYQFARNLAAGDGFSYNPGEPTPGSTAPLWTLLLAVVGLFTSDFLIPSLILSGLFLVFTVWLTYGFTRDLLGENGTFWALLAALGVAATGRMLWAGLAGMETTAFAAASVAAVWSYHRYGLRPLPVLLFALGSQLRPEGHALFALALLDTAWSSRRHLPQHSRALLAALAVYAVVAAPYALFSMATTGHPLPNTFYAKAGSTHFFSLRTLRETLAYHWQDNPVAFLLLPVGLVSTCRRQRLAAAWLVGLPVLTALVIDATWHHGRYTLPLIPFQMIAAALGGAWLTRSRWYNGQLSSRAKRILSLALLVLVVSAAAVRLQYWAGMLGYNSNEILEIDVALGHWLAANTPPDALVAVDDIGAIAFLAQRRIVDLNGLVSPEMWPAIRNEAEGRPRNEAAARILSYMAPDYLVAFPTWHWEIATNSLVAAPVYRRFVDTHSIIGEQEAIVYQMTWPYRPHVEPQVDRQVLLGSAIELYGYDLDVPSPAEGPLELTLYWHSLMPVHERYDVFVHVLDEGGTIVAQADQEPVAGLAPTSRWQPGDYIRDPYTIELPTDLPAGRYHLTTGMYLRGTGERLPVGDASAGGDVLLLTPFDWQPAGD